ncbi:McrC family protein [Pelotalea chapellei]|uniref:McrC family protein n=1 Tax=Pelotalea chapellei TaxID=44671 RepID=A0ABS5U4V9_9BACT|nr:McrC family protein [Pelotalea chapellei]
MTLKDPNTMVLREFESCLIGSRWSSTTKTITARELSVISTYQEQTGNKLFAFGYRSIKATNWVGTFGIGDKSIEVIPKIDSSAELLPDAPTRENLLTMVAAAGYVSLARSEIARLTYDSKPLLAAFLDLYVDNLAREWRRGPIKRYVTLTENRQYLRGKLLIPEHIKLNGIQQQRFFTASDEFVEDNTVAQLLKAALHRCQRQKLCEQVSRKAKGLMPDFETVALIDFSAGECERVCVDRQIKRFEPLVNLAKIILRNCSPSSSPAGDAVYSLMFDMNEVFERFIAAELHHALAGRPVNVQSQVSGKSLLNQNGRGRFRLCPDLGVFHGKSTLCLLDTKWKRLDMDKSYANVSQADMYQMYAYGKEFDSPRTVLLYPRFSNLADIVATYEHNNSVLDSDSGISKQIVVATIDVSAPLNSLSGRQALHYDLTKAVFG